VKTNILLAIALLSPLAAWAADDIKPFDAKPGLWEYTSTVQIAGMPANMPGMQIPDEARKSMTPEQLARIEGMMSRGGSPQPTVIKVCVTRDSFDKAIAQANKRNSSCTQKVVNSSSSKLEIHMECSAEKTDQKTVMDMAFDRVDAEHFKGGGTVKSSGSGRSMEMKITMGGKYLSSDCGDVKPAGQ